MTIDPQWVQAICAVIATILLVVSEFRRRKGGNKKNPIPDIA